MMITDTNECRTGQHNCSETLEDCRKSVGSFDCECKDGYTRNANTDMCEGNYLYLTKVTTCMS